MKKDNIEDFIKANHDSFYDETPPQGAWEKIGENISAGKKQPVSLRRYLRLAAAAVILVAVTFAATRYFILSDIVVKGSALSAEIRSKIENAPEKEIAIKPVNKEQPAVQKNYIAQNKTKNIDPVKNSSPVYSDIEEINMYYTSQIYSRKNEIFRYASVSNEVNHEVNIEISQMDSVYKSVIRDLKDNMNNKEVVESLILQYRLKLEFLDNILELIKESENPTPKNVKYEM
jgi:hypothetical protein